MIWRQTTSLALCIGILGVACHTREPYAAREGPVSIARGDAVYLAPLVGTVVINDTNLPIDHWGNDPYEFAMDDDAPVIADNTLTLAVSYGGGCARHDFTLIADSRFLQSHPVQLVVFLAHDANDDRCEAYPTDRYEFDLTPIRRLYQQAYGKNKGVVGLLLRGPETEHFATYRF